ncbi:MAG: hypothetical protein GXX94_07020 [Chloroflexi bacterium]|nr:hypothetical protein [Chloroflexota bacterium]
MEVVSAVQARLVEYEHALWKFERSNPLRVAKGESDSWVLRTLSHLSR